jgi:hypothetical protein
MTHSLSERMTRERARPAARASGGVAVVLILQLLISTVLSVISYIGYGAVGSPSGLWDTQTLFSPFLGFWYSLAGQIVPFAIGVFLAFWLVVPLAASQGVVRVVVRSVAASAIGALVSFLALAVYGVGTALASVGPWFGGSMPRFDGYPVVLAASNALQNAALQFVQNTPLVVLAGILVIYLATLAPRGGANIPGRIS